MSRVKIKLNEKGQVHCERLRVCLVEIRLNFIHLRTSKRRNEQIEILAINLNANHMSGLAEEIAESSNLWRDSESLNCFSYLMALRA
jgi:hypothetical protein